MSYRCLIGNARRTKKLVNGKEGGLERVLRKPTMTRVPRSNAKLPRSRGKNENSLDYKILVIRGKEVEPRTEFYQKRFFPSQSPLKETVSLRSGMPDHNTERGRSQRRVQRWIRKGHRHGLQHQGEKDVCCQVPRVSRERTVRVDGSRPGAGSSCL